jgi:hypothetical protein
VIPALGRIRNFEASLAYVGRPCLKKKTKAQQKTPDLRRQFLIIYLHPMPFAFYPFKIPHVIVHKTYI